MVIYSNSDPTNPTDSAAIAVAISISRLVPNLVDVLLSLVLLTSAVLYSLNLGSSIYLLLVYLFYFPISPSLNKTILAFLTFCSFLYLAILRILYRPIKK